MSNEAIIALVIGILLGLWLKRPKVKLVTEEEGATIARVREACNSEIKWRHERLLSERCGWSEADDLRAGIGHHRSILELLPEAARVQPEQQP